MDPLLATSIAKVFGACFEGIAESLLVPLVDSVVDLEKQAPSIFKMLRH